MKNTALQLRNSLATDLATWRQCAIEANAKAESYRTQFDYRNAEWCDNDCMRYTSMFHALVMYAATTGIISEYESAYLFDGLQQEIAKGTIETEYYRCFMERGNI